MAVAEPDGIDETYWKENQADYAASYEKRRDQWQPHVSLDPKGRCTKCLNPDKGIARMLIKIGTTAKKKLDVWACPECDGGLLSNFDKRATN